MGTYQIIQEGYNKYVFFTDLGVEYQLVIKNSGIFYKKPFSNNEEIIEIALNCDINTACKDYKTLRTLVKFYTEITEKHEAVYMQIHNQLEDINKGISKRRGLSRIKLWNRTASNYSDNNILFTNLILDPNKNSDFMSIIIKKDSIYFKEILTNFYRFCHFKMYTNIY